jgi:hypothetical protein
MVFCDNKIHRNEWLFGETIDGIMQLNKAEEIVQNELIFYEILPDSMFGSVISMIGLYAIKRN